MKNSFETGSLLIVLFWLLSIIIYITNFVQFVVAISDDKPLSLIIIKLIGVLSFFGSYITVWF